jgi:hypothetical protein
MTRVRFQEGAQDFFLNSTFQIEILIAKQLVPDPSPFEVEPGIANLDRHTSPGSYQTLPELIQAGDEILSSQTHKLINSTGIRKDCLIIERGLHSTNLQNEGQN